MLNNKAFLFLVSVVFCVCGCAGHPGRDTLYQVSTIQALSAGDYDGQASVRGLRRRGDFGLGTFHGLEGEMVILDGNFYQVKVDGKAYPVKEARQIPFAQVTFFDADNTFEPGTELDYAGFKKYRDSARASRNIFYAVKISGRFRYVKTRSVPKQPKPYPGLDQAVKEQQVFEFNDIEGIVVGFRSPEYSGNFSVGGYHLHFISEDRKRGGHLLDFQASRVKIEVDETADFYLSLPTNPEFLNLDLDRAEEKGAESE